MFKSIENYIASASKELNELVKLGVYTNDKAGEIQVQIEADANESFEGNMNVSDFVDQCASLT